MGEVAMIDRRDAFPPAARHRVRRLGFSRPPCRARAGQARLPHPRRGAPAGPRRASAAARRASARSTPCRRTCAIPDSVARAVARRRRAWSISSASCRRAAGRRFDASRRTGAEAVAAAPRPRRARSSTSRRSAPTPHSASAYARTKAEGEAAVLAGAAGRGRSSGPR